MQPNITITLDQNALNQTVQTADGIAGMVLQGVAVVSTLDINTPYAIYSLEDAEDLGIVQGGSNDFAWTQIKGFYDEALAGAELFIMVSDQTLPNMVDKDNEYAVKLLNYAEGTIRLLAIGVESDGDETITNGLDANAHLAVAKANALAEQFSDEYKPLRVVVGGNVYSGTPADLVDYKDNTTNRVAMFISADDNSKTASVGKFLGRLAKSPVQRKPSRVLDGPVEEVVEAYLTDGETVEDSDSTLDAIHDKGYIFYRRHVGRAGYFYSSDVTLTADSDDYNSIARGRVIDKAYLITYDTLLNHLSDEVELESNGRIDSSIVKAWEGEVENAIFANMKDTGESTRPEISGVEVTIDPTQNIASTNTLSVEVRIQPVGYADFIDVILGYALTVNQN